MCRSQLRPRYTNLATISSKVQLEKAQPHISQPSSIIYPQVQSISIIAEYDHMQFYCYLLIYTSTRFCLIYIRMRILLSEFRKYEWVGPPSQKLVKYTWFGPPSWKFCICHCSSHYGFIFIFLFYENKLSLDSRQP